MTDLSLLRPAQELVSGIVPFTSKLNRVRVTGVKAVPCCSWCNGLFQQLISTDNQLLLGLESPTDTKHMAIGMAKVHLADVHGITVGGNVTSRLATTQCLCISSTSSTPTDIQAPLSPSSSPVC